MSKIALLLSGGVDSSVALHMLCQTGVKPDCFYIHIGPDEDDSYSCTSEEDVEMASAVAHKYGCKFEIVDLHKEYWDKVVTYTMNTIKKGYTPNPDVMCNTLIKFGAFYKKIGHNYDYIATGHYATRVGYTITPLPNNAIIEFHDNDVINKPVDWNNAIEWWICPAKDPVKDQVDFIANINTFFVPISKMIFPVGNLMKDEVRKIAEENHLVNAKRKDSQGICFLGKINYNDYIRKYLGNNPGEIIDIDNNKWVGMHYGYWFYTIGQRKGLGLSGGPWYVVAKDVKNNIVYVSNNAERNAETKFKIGNINWLTRNLINDYKDLNENIDSDIICNITFKIRHSPETYSGKLKYINDNDSLVIICDNPITVAPGQYCILYDDTYSRCYGCGEITY